jgi:hypothetical protein
MPPVASLAAMTATWNGQHTRFQIHDGEACAAARLSTNPSSRIFTPTMRAMPNIGRQIPRHVRTLLEFGFRGRTAGREFARYLDGG